MTPRPYALTDAARAQRRAASAAASEARAVGPTRTIRVPASLADQIEARREGREPLWRVIERAFVRP